MSRISSSVFIQITTILTLFFSLVGATDTSADEILSTLQFSEILPVNIQRGTGYVIGNIVRIDDNRYIFEAKTDYGGFSAKGLPMLELRLKEHYSIERLRQISKQSLVLEGVADVVKETPRGAITFLKDPTGD